MNGKGYEVEVLENYPSALNCVICSLIINKATHGCERHVFCEACIQEYLTKSCGEDDTAVCPGGCRKEIDDPKKNGDIEKKYASLLETRWTSVVRLQRKLSPNLAFDMMINKLKSKCSFKNCSWTGDLLDLVKDHRMRCKFIQINCYRRECGELILKDDVHKHNQVCLYNTYCCPYCQNCRILRKNQSDHEELCKLEKVDCVYKEVGCWASICRGEVEQHEQDNLSKHLKLTFEKMTKNEKLLEESNKEIRQLKSENYSLNQQVSKLNKETTKTATQVLYLKGHIKGKTLTANSSKDGKMGIDVNEIEKLKEVIKEKISFMRIDNDMIIIQSTVVISSGYRIDKSDELHELIMSSKYEENYETIFTTYYRNNSELVLDIFKLLPFHWYDFTHNALVNETKEIQHVIKFPISDNNVEDFFCQYKEMTVQSINNTIQVLGFTVLQKDYKVSINGETREVEVEVDCGIDDLLTTAFSETTTVCKSEESDEVECKVGVEYDRISSGSIIIYKN